MIKHLKWPNTVKLAQTEAKHTQAMNNTNHKLTIIYDNETTKETNTVYDEKHNP